MGTDNKVVKARGSVRGWMERGKGGGKWGISVIVSAIGKRKDRVLWFIFSWFLFPSPCWKHEEIFLRYLL